MSGLCRPVELAYHSIRQRQVTFVSHYRIWNLSRSSLQLPFPVLSCPDITIWDNESAHFYLRLSNPMIMLVWDNDSALFGPSYSN